MKIVQYVFLMIFVTFFAWMAFAQGCKLPLFDHVTAQGNAPVQGQVPGLTLGDCYQLALKRSESIAIQKELIGETEGQVRQALSTALPRIAFDYTYKWQDADGNDTTNRRRTPQAGFTFTQPLFTGFKEFAAIAASRHLGRQRELELKRARELLYTDVADAFYLYLTYEEGLAVLKKTHGALEERIAELQKRESVGRSRKSEVASAESKYLLTEADMESLSAQKDISAQVLEFLTGEKIARLRDDALDLQDEPLPSPEGYYALVDRRADVLAAVESVEVYKRQITSARSSFLPSASVTGNSYAKRVGSARDVDWDVLLSVNVPLFNAKNDLGLVRQARAQLRQAEWRLTLARRKALADIRSAYIQLSSDMRRVKALSKALEAAEINYQLQQEDFERSLVNNLDVLQALVELEAVRSSYARAQNDMKRSYARLQVATGEVSP
jgi:outer membrane protein TolC